MVRVRLSADFGRVCRVSGHVAPSVRPEIRVEVLRQLVWHSRDVFTFCPPAGGAAVVMTATHYIMALRIVIAAGIPLAARCGGEAPDPYPLLHGVDCERRPAQLSSPDPLQRCQWRAGIDASRLQVYYLSPQTVHVQQPASFIGAHELARDGTRSGGAVVVGFGALRFDFGQENAGWLEFDVVGDGASQVTLLAAVSEYSEPAVVNEGPAHPNKTAAPKRYAQQQRGGRKASSMVTTFRLELNDELYEGVRFGWIFFEPLAGAAHPHPFRPFNLSAVRLVCQTKPMGYAGSFAASDPTLERIWWVAAYTVRLTAQADYFGSILMDRGDRFSWTGDAHTIQACAFVAFNDTAFVLHNLNRTACAKCSNGIEPYALYWVLSLCDYWEAVAGVDALLHYVGAAREKLDHALAIFGTDPALHFMGGDERLGAYFEDPDRREAQRSFSMLVIRACFAFAATCEAASAQARGTASTALAHVAAIYDAHGRRLVSSLRRSSTTPWYQGYGMLAATGALNAGFLNASETAAMLRPFADPLQRVAFTPFNQYFVVRALFEAGEPSLALDAMRRCWAGQLALGATTFWETFSPEWQHLDADAPTAAEGETHAQGQTHLQAAWYPVMPTPGAPNITLPRPPPNGQNGYTSLCHPWASGVAALLTRYVLGLRSTSAGYRTWQVLPYGLIAQPPLEHVGGTHPCGLQLRLNGSSGRFLVSGAPLQSVGRIGIPKFTRNGALLRHVSMRGAHVWPARACETDGCRSPPADAEGELLPGLAIVEGLRCDGVHGACLLIATYDEPDSHRSAVDGAPQDAAALMRTDQAGYRAQFLGFDRTSHGDWIGRYGSRGYVLFSYAEPGVDATHLPRDGPVAAYSVHRGHESARNLTWQAAQAGPAALQNPLSFVVDGARDSPTSAPQPARSLGAIATNNPHACKQDFIIDIRMRSGITRPTNVTLYLADATSAAREQVVELFDLETLRTVSPWRRVARFERGVYLTWRYRGSMRLKVAYLRATAGADAVASAVFFD